MGAEPAGEAKATLLVVDDEAVLAGLLTDALTFAGYRVRVAGNGNQAIAAVAKVQPDLIILDVNLPDLDGFSVATKLRASGDQTPIIYLTARDNPTDLRTGYTSGGDDYLTKPFRLEELQLRVAAVLRRSKVQRESATNRLGVADVVMDIGSHRVYRGDREIDLSPTEFKLLHHLLVNHDKVLSKTDLLSGVWGYDFNSDTSLVETYILYLRRKIDVAEPKLIHTVRGVGYVLRTPERSP